MVQFLSVSIPLKGVDLFLVWLIQQLGQGREPWVDHIILAVTGFEIHVRAADGA